MGMIHLHSHSQFSSDGYGTAIDRAKFASSIGQTALGQTDHGNTSGLVAHYHACKKFGIKPILGVEAYYQPTFDKDGKRYHMTILCESLEGYRNLNRIMTIAARDYFYRYPVVTWDVLAQYQEGLIVLSGCIAGLAPQLILQDQIEEAREVMAQFQWLLGDRFYGETMPFMDSDNQQHIVNKNIIDLCRSLDIQVALTSDSHYTSIDDRETHALMFQLKNYKPEADYSSLYLTTEEEVVQGWNETMKDYPSRIYSNAKKFINVTQSIADRCDVSLEFKEDIPKLKWDKPSSSKLADLCKEGLRSKGKYKGDKNKKYRDQLAFEFNVIQTKGYTDYFLLCYDIYQFAASRGIAHGKGRGSVCGSVLAYALGLTDVDPLIYGTKFERFLRPNKTTLPDIDMDWESERRHEILEYLLEKYDGQAAHISTFGYYKIKNLINDLGKLMAVSTEDMDQIKGQLEGMLDDSDAYKLDDKEALYEYLLTNKDLKRLNNLHSKIIKHFSRLFGQVRYTGVHPAGIAITNGPVEDYFALIRTKDGLQACYDMNDISALNIVKIDCLGLITIDILQEVEKLIGKAYEMDDILDDAATWDQFGEGHTLAVFQFESRLGMETVKKAKPRSLLDLAACSGLNRPAPLKFGLLDKFIEGKNGNIDESGLLYQHTSDTYGVVIYQEQVMLIGLWAGLDWYEIDKLIKGISKKTAGKDAIHDKFVLGCVVHGMEEEEASKLYSSMTLYLFNKGHGCGYSLFSFYAMYLKVHHPLEFWLATLKYEKEDIKRIGYELEAVKKQKIGILTPSVNGSADYSIASSAGSLWIRKGMSNIPGVGDKAAKYIEKEGPYEDYMDLMRKVPKRILNARVWKALEDSGALQFDISEQLKASVTYCSRLPQSLKDARQKEREKLSKTKAKKPTLKKK